MDIPTFDDLKHTIAASIQRHTATPSGSSGARLIWPLVLACGFLIFVTGSSLFLVRSSQTIGERVNRALGVETKLWIVLNSVRVTESGQRGYLLTGDPDYLDEYRASKDLISPTIAELKAEIRNPELRRALAEIEPFIARKLAELDETIRLHDAGRGEEALALVRSGIGRALMTEIRTRSFRMLDMLQHIVDVRLSNWSSAGEWLIAVNLLGLTLIIALSLVSILFMRRLVKTELSYVRALERSNQELDDFAYIASHDLKEPLRGLFNHTTFLLEDYADKIDEDGVRRLNRLGTLCQRMEQLINDLMYFSRLGRADLAIQSTDPNAVIVEIGQMMEILLSERGARIVVPRTLPLIVCDKTRVTEVFRNLITNAVKYNDKAERLVEVGFLESVKTNAGLERNVFYVKDNGLGIDPEFHEEIFHIFRRLQNTPDGQEAGTGVGLTFVKKIVERHGGRIWLDSETGIGTVFYFSLNCGRKETARNSRAGAIEPIPVHSAG
jgi:signal transduction histidine kinase